MERPYLLPDERVLLTSRRHGGAAVAPLATVGVLAGAAAIVAALTVGWVWLIAAFWILVWIAQALWLWRVHITARFTLTPWRTYHAVGRLFFRVHFSTHEKVTDLEVKQGPLGRALGFGTLWVRTAGGDVAMAGMRDPFAFREALERTRQGYLDHLVRRAAPAPDTPAPERTRGPARVLWEGQPCGWVLAGKLVAAAVSLVFFVPPLLGLAVGLLGPAGLWLAVAVSVLGYGTFATIASLAHKRIQYTVTTRGAITQRGLFTSQRAETTWDKVTDVNTTQGVVARMAGYATIVLNTAGSAAAPVHFVGVMDPDRAKEVVEWARQQ